jgi:hypothetical protein
MLGWDKSFLRSPLWLPHGLREQSISAACSAVSMEIWKQHIKDFSPMVPA